MNLRIMANQIEREYRVTMLDVVRTAPNKGEVISQANSLLREKACALRDAQVAIEQLLKIEAKEVSLTFKSQMSEEVVPEQTAEPLLRAA